MKLRIDTQIIGLMSTPATGGTTFRVVLSKGSVGMATTLQGSSSREYFGNQERTTRIKKKMVPIDSIGPSTNLVGAIQDTSLAEAGSTIESSATPAMAASASPRGDAGTEDTGGGAAVRGRTAGVTRRQLTSGASESTQTTTSFIANFQSDLAGKERRSHSTRNFRLAALLRYGR